MERDRQIGESIARTAGMALFLYGLSRWGFHKDVKRQAYENQGGLSPEGKPIEEYHHIVPEKMLKKQGLRGRNVIENCIGLSFEEHKGKWDKLAAEGIFYPGVTIDMVPNEAYEVGHFNNKHKKSKKRRRRR